MIRGWLIFSSLVFGVMFRLWRYNQAETVSFLFSEHRLDLHSYVYFFMEHIIALQIAGCIIIKDSTPRYLFWIFIAILILDFMHYLLFFRDEGIGWNLIKAVIFGIPLLYFELSRIWTQLKP